MRKRHCDALNIYTYVADIVLCLNPYMYLPKMVDIKEYPEQVIYHPGTNPSSYASAHFAYYGTLDEKAEKRNNSCIVSGESGAGKTVACSKYSLVLIIYIHLLTFSSSYRSPRLSMP